MIVFAIYAVAVDDRGVEVVKVVVVVVVMMVNLPVIG